MIRKVTEGEYRALGELRFRIRRFVQEGDATAREAGLEPQQYLLLLAIRGLPEGKESSIRAVAERLSLQHHSTVELVDRMEQHGYVRRARSSADRRQVLVTMEPRGKKLLEEVARKRIIELRSNGRTLVEAIGALLERPRKKAGSKQATAQSKKAAGRAGKR